MVQRRIGGIAGLGLLACFCAMLAGCALTGSGTEGGKGTSQRSREADTLVLRNGDSWQGTLDLETVRLSTPYAGELVIERKHLDRAEVLASGDMRIRTKDGSVLQTKPVATEFRFRTKVGADLTVKADQVREILFK